MAITKNEVKQNKSKLRKELTMVSFGVLVTIMALAVATFAWYVYYTQANSNSVRMSAGSSIKLEISNEYNGTYSSAVDLATFKGTLNPVSTDVIGDGSKFQKVYGFSDGSETKSKVIANLFGPAESSDYFNTSVFVRTNGPSQGVYIAGFSFEETAEISKAMRVGVVVHEPGENKPIAAEYIFELNPAQTKNRQYNTEKGFEGCVLDSTKTDGSVVDFRPYLKTADNFVIYNKDTGEVTKKPGSLKLFNLAGAGDKKPGTAVQVDIYLYLEGCDADCVGGIIDSFGLNNFAVLFASIAE